jgi:hypothetical protein
MSESAPPRPVLTASHAEAALDIAREIGRRLADVDRVEAAVRRARALTDEPRLVHWRPEGLWQGYAGLALLSATLDRIEPDAGWDVVGRDQIRCATTGLEARTDRGAGFGSAIRGVAAAAHALSRDGTRYRKLTGTLDAALADLGAARARTLINSAPHGVAVATYDVIGGLAGIGRQLLDAGTTTTDAIATVLHSLIGLSAAGPDGVARWHTPTDAMTGGFLAGSYPAGLVNLGLAHGIPGPLALLSIATAAGVNVDGQRDAIHRTADAIVAAELQDAWGVTFPIAAAVGDNAVAPTPGRNAWCYGSPGVARSLWLAGIAVRRADLCDLAVETMLAVGRRPVAARRIDSPTLCHGIAGLLAITVRFAADTGRADFADMAGDLASSLVNDFEPESTFGYRNLEPTGNRIDHPGLLDGAAGVALALAGAATVVGPTWDRVLLLS